MVLWADTCCIVCHDLNYIMAVKHSHSFSLSSCIVLCGTIMQYTQETIHFVVAWKPLHYSSTIQSELQLKLQGVSFYGVYLFLLPCSCLSLCGHVLTLRFNKAVANQVRGLLYFQRPFSTIVNKFFFKANMACFVFKLHDAQP